jgi:hypothetical protein
MKTHVAIVALLTSAAILAVCGLASPATAAEEFFSAKLRGGNETPVTISSTGSGLFGAQIDPSESSLTFALLYSDIQGGSVVGAHIHLGRPAITGGIVIHFCGTGGKPACPASPGVVSGVVTSADVVAVPSQGIAAGDLASVLRAIRKGDAYVNVHTATFPGGEIRGDIQ